MTAARALVDRVVGMALAALMAAAVLNVSWQLFTRFVLESPSSFTGELARYLLVWMGLLGAGHAVGQRLHLSVDLVPKAWHARADRGLVLFGDALVFVFAFAVLVVGGSRLVALTLSLGQQSAALRIPLGWIYLVLPLTGLLVMFHAAAGFAATLTGEGSGRAGGSE